MAVIVVIRGCYSHGIARTSDACLLRNVCESAVAIIPEQPVKELRPRFFQRWNGGAIRDKNVRPAVAVIIEYGDSRDHGFDEMLSSGCAIVHDHIQRRCIEANRTA